VTYLLPARAERLPGRRPEQRVNAPAGVRAGPLTVPEEGDLGYGLAYLSPRTHRAHQVAPRHPEPFARRAAPIALTTATWISKLADMPPLATARPAA